MHMVRSACLNRWIAIVSHPRQTAFLDEKLALWGTVIIFIPKPALSVKNCNDKRFYRIRIQATNVVIVIYDLLGHEIDRLAWGQTESGYYKVIWNGRTADGKDVPTGIYIARLSIIPPMAGMTPEYTNSIKMVLMK